MALAGIVGGPTFAQDQVSLVKAGFITKFPQFVGWPDQPGLKATSPFTLCVLGTTPVAPFLQQVAAHSRIKGQRPTVLYPDNLQSTLGCKVLFVAASERARLDEIVAFTRDKPILTVGDTPDFAARGILINLYQDHGQVRFEINRNAVSQTGLSIGFRLLEAARIVE